MKVAVRRLRRKPVSRLKRTAFPLLAGGLTALVLPWGGTASPVWFKNDPRVASWADSSRVIARKRSSFTRSGMVVLIFHTP